MLVAACTGIGMGIASALAMQKIGKKNMVNGFKVNKPNDTKSAKRLQMLSHMTVELLKIIKLKHMQHKGCKMLIKRFDCPKDICRIQERSGVNRHEVGYTVNKGESIGLCLKHDGEETNNNTMKFVYLHELAHVMSSKYGHGDEFWNNFAYLLKIAVKANLYKYEDFNNTKGNYCGKSIEYTPYIK